jgi:hypothetical protein
MSRKKRGKRGVCVGGEGRRVPTPPPPTHLPWGLHSILGRNGESEWRWFRAGMENWGKIPSHEPAQWLQPFRVMNPVCMFRHIHDKGEGEGQRETDRMRVTGPGVHSVPQTQIPFAFHFAKPIPTGRTRQCMFKGWSLHGVGEYCLVNPRGWVSESITRTVLHVSTHTTCKCT